MTKAQQKRKEKLLSNGKPRWVRIYDNAGLPNESADNITVVFTGRYRTRGLKRGEKPHTDFYVLCMNASPFHPHGFCQRTTYPYQIDARNGAFPPAMGRKGNLGRRIPFEDLPEDCQKAVLEDYLDLWDL